MLMGGVALAGLPGGYADGQPLTKAALDSNFSYLQSEIAGDGGLQAQVSVLQGASAPSVSAAAFEVSQTCAQTGNAMDCTCPAGTIAMSGGGWCGAVANNFLTESAAVGPAHLSVWRTNCSSAPPTGAYALCLKSR